MRTSNHQVDGEGCSWRQTFTDAAGRMHWDHVFVTELLSNSSYRPVHDFIMGAEYMAVARVRRALAEVPKRYLKCLKTDCLVMQDVPKKHRSAIERLLRLSHRDGTPVYRCEPTEGLRGQCREPRMEAEPIKEKPAWRRVEDPLTHCLGGESLLLTGYPGTGKTHLARKIVEALWELGDTVHIITKTHAAVQNVGLGAQTADHWVRRNVRSGRCSATWLERVTLESGQSFEPRELLKHTRLCSAITYASVQGLTLRGRVWLCDVESPHFTMKHLYMGCSRATSSELLSVL